MLPTVYETLQQAYWFDSWKEFSSFVRQDDPTFFPRYYEELEFVNVERVQTEQHQRNARKRLKAAYESGKFHVDQDLRVFYVPLFNEHEPPNSPGNSVRQLVDSCLDRGDKLPFDRMRRVVPLGGAFEEKFPTLSLFGMSDIYFTEMLPVLQECHEIRDGLPKHVGQKATVTEVAKKYVRFISS